MVQFKFLYGPEIESAEQQLPPEQRVSWPLDSLIMYCYDDDRVIGRMGLMSIKIVEGTYVVPNAPPTTAFRMMKQMEAMIAYLGNTHVMALVYDGTPQIADYLERVNFKREPLSVYSKEVAKAKEKAP